METSRAVEDLIRRAEGIKAQMTMPQMLLERYCFQCSNNRMPCPLCKLTKRDSFIIYDDGWTCHACNEAGDLFAFIMQYEGVNFRKAVELLENGVEIDKEVTARFARTKAKKQAMMTINRLKAKGIETRQKLLFKTERTVENLISRASENKADLDQILPFVEIRSRTRQEIYYTKLEDDEVTYECKQIMKLR